MGITSNGSLWISSGIKNPGDLTNTKASLRVDEVDLLRANTDNTWPITARYVANIQMSSDIGTANLAGNTLEIEFSSEPNANVTINIPYHFDIGNTISWLAANVGSQGGGNVSPNDFALGSGTGFLNTSNVYGRGNSAGNIILADNNDIEQDLMRIDLYTNGTFVGSPSPYFYIKKNKAIDDFVFTTAGTTTWTVPSGITQVSIVVIGGGGGRGAATTNAGGWIYGGGGGGGALAWVNNISVTPGETLDIAVGAGGTAGTYPGGNGTAGGASYVSRSGTSLVRANGGTGGVNDNGGSGGTVVTGTGYSGGNGSNNNTAAFRGGLGGGAGGYGAAGTSGGYFVVGTEYPQYGISGPTGTPTSIWGWDGNTQVQTTTEFLYNAQGWTTPEYVNYGGNVGSGGNGRDGRVRIIAPGNVRQFPLLSSCDRPYFADAFGLGIF